MGIKPSLSLALKPRFSGWQSLASELWRENSASAKEELAMVRREPKRARAQVFLHAKLPRTDYVRPNGSLEDAVQRAANQVLPFENADGTPNPVSGRVILNKLITSDSVKVWGLEQLENLDDMSPKDYERLGRSNQYIQEDILPTLGGGGAGNKGILYQFLGDAQRQGVLYLLKDNNPNRLGKSYYGVPTEVRAILAPAKTGALEAPQCLNTPQSEFVRGLKDFLSQPDVQKQPDAELFESIANFARAASSPVANLDGFGYGDVPAEIRGTKAFADSSETRVASALLSLLEATFLIEPKLEPQVETLCKKAVAAELLSKAELSEVLAQQAV
jgi:hypothetical protein